MSESTRVLVGLGVGLGAGLAIAASHNPTLLRAADSVAPIGSLWVNAIRMTVIPLIVSLVITGVASASSVGTVGKIGRRTICGVHCDADRRDDPRAAAWHRGVLMDVTHRHGPA
jgi:Na+/H+-dicarboxylate symporter